MRALDPRGVEPLLFDTARLEADDYVLSEKVFELGDTRLERGRGWIRRFAPPGWRDDSSPRSHEGVLRAAWVALLSGVITRPGIEWLTPLDQLSLAEQKLFQAQAARSIGIDVPKTVVASQPDRIPPALGDRLIVKPLGPGAFVDPTGETFVVYTTPLARDDERLEQLKTAPFIIQERVDADLHLRVATVRDHAWVCRLEAADELDWRRNDDAHDAFEPTFEFPEVSDAALALTRALDVGYSSQDWIVSGTRRVFVDLNPGGQWLFLPAEVSKAVTEAIADWLAGSP